MMAGGTDSARQQTTLAERLAAHLRSERWGTAGPLTRLPRPSDRMVVASNPGFPNGIPHTPPALFGGDLRLRSEA
jgi:hypothetical protein